MASRRQFGLSAAALLLAPAVKAAEARPPTPGMSPGPFRPIRWPSDADHDLTRIRGRRDQAQGRVIEVAGRILRTDGSPVPRARINLWQANAAGRYRHAYDPLDKPLDPAFEGAARLTADADGGWRIRTIMPGPYPGAGGMRAPHLHFEVWAPDGMVITQMLFAGEALNEDDPLLRGLRASGGRPPDRVLARAETPGADGVARYGWDCVLMKPRA
jgi:protocatechuate 3,4-dioxygenase beta subunit